MCSVGQSPYENTIILYQQNFLILTAKCASINIQENYKMWLCVGTPSIVRYGKGEEAFDITFTRDV
ncbi:hypothetical protein NQ317_019108 [Molorchus minor]|uniref:Uncharacterized protein n=1 Tax=Molorchus minor TaxID=1323400 RepID=A0ABQ9JL99_9CUCU|nr:hypothetical protein NQ317_019108 [Molorchus minor]